MSVTDQQVQEWRNHPVTQEIFKALLEVKQEASTKQSYYQVNATIDQVALASAHNTGIVTGIDTLLTIMMGEDYEGKADEES